MFGKKNKKIKELEDLLYAANRDKLRAYDQRDAAQRQTEKLLANPEVVYGSVKPVVVYDVYDVYFSYPAGVTYTKRGTYRTSEEALKVADTGECQVRAVRLWKIADRYYSSNRLVEVKFDE